MESREIKITLETAMRMYEQGGEFREIALGAFNEKELIGYRLPKTWEEYRTISGDEGEKVNVTLNFVYTSINRAFTDYHDAKKHIALMKLHLLRDEYRQGWKPDFDSASYCIILTKKGLCIDRNYTIGRFLSFQTEELAEKFLENFRDLIEEARDLI